jgi:site-specific recombinase XerD
MAWISKRIVDAARPGRKPIFTWDSRLAGFALLTLPSGQRSYVFQYRVQGRSRRATIGKVGTLTPEQARRIAETMSQRVKGGGDPLADKAASRDALTVAGLLDRYTASARYAQKAAQTQKTGIGQIEWHLKPLLGKRLVAGLGQDDIRRAFAAIRDGQTAARIRTGPRGLARVMGGEGAARYACRLLRAAFTWAVDEGLIERNPTTGIDFGSDGERATVLDAEGYARLFAALATMEAERRLRPAVADAVRIIAMSGARRGEIAGLRWRHVDIKGGRIVLPASGHKTGRRTGKPRVIHLPAAAQQIIACQPEGNPDDFVFSPSKGEGPVSLAKPWRAIRAQAGLPEGIGLHGLRHSLATLLAVGGAQAAEIMTSLGHRQMSTTTRYLHFADAARAALAERAAAPALAGMAAASGAPQAAIVELPHSKRRA